jgi:hypothetical protein
MSKKEEFSTLVSINKCPICSRELERGYLGAPVRRKNNQSKTDVHPKN